METILSEGAHTVYGFNSGHAETHDERTVTENAHENFPNLFKPAVPRF